MSLLKINFFVLVRVFGQIFEEVVMLLMTGTHLFYLLDLHAPRDVTS
jgi:hypothetical protein